MNLYSVMFTSCESGGFFSHEFTSFNHGGVCCVNPPLTQNIWDPEILVFTVILFSIMHPPPKALNAWLLAESAQSGETSSFP